MRKIKAIQVRFEQTDYDKLESIAVIQGLSPATALRCMFLAFAGEPKQRTAIAGNVRAAVAQVEEN